MVYDSQRNANDLHLIFIWSIAFLELSAVDS